MNLVIKILFPICVLLAWISSNVSRQGAIAYTIFSIALGYFLLRNQKKYQKEKYQKESNNQDALKKWELEYEQQKIKRHQQSERDKQRREKILEKDRLRKEKRARREEEERLWKEKLARLREEERLELIRKFGELGATKIRKKEIWLDAPLEAVIKSWGQPDSQTAAGRQLRLRYGIPPGGSRAKNWVVLKKVSDRRQYVVTDFNSETRY